MDEGILELVKAIQDVAPMVWEVTMKQVAIEGVYAGWWLALAIVVDVIPWSICLVGCLVAVFGDCTDQESAITAVIVGAFFGLLLFVFVLSAHQGWITYIQNPEYMAIQKLLRQVK